VEVAVKRVLVVAAVGAAMVVASSPAAFAGEVNGTGGVTPAKYMSRSNCAFSGLQDDPLSPGTTQNWGQIIKHAGPLGGANSVYDGKEYDGCNAMMYPNPNSKFGDN
jgi:hypothetical protein